MIGYNAHCCKKNSCLSLAKRQLANADFDLAAEPFNPAGVIVSNIENIIRLFFCLSEAAFKIHLAQKSERARATHLNGHDASVCVYIYIVTKSQPMDCVKKPIFKRLNIYWIKTREN